MAYLLDTNVVSELGKQRGCDPNVCVWYDSIEGSTEYLSSLVIGELTRGIHQLSKRDLPQATRLAAWLTGIKEHYASRIIPVDTAAAIIWGRWQAASPIPVVDGLMAATAYLNDWTFVTRNVKDVERTGVRTLDPFEPMATSS
ncbi:type II toxin-antitoxin system VapC family toxin [Actinoallomurus rhizosphaericola]|uniref:type II toxin-antitoxin system VapC family toxin n=1 Tax=Actinoallomurus rhizosphaericola TaxID=2952536 RepID=UPI00209247CB|nr:type II toxin-antitoxin system VapC family toxin [Actinoallomurus rhizosphaericola]MCO5999261.1 type II toxin-antitoxin system VapC family toxin [Actinoallomurus rhizosphaericola]